MNHEELVEAVEQALKATGVLETAHVRQRINVIALADALTSIAEPLIRADERKRVQDGVLAWLGCYRDSLSSEAITSLQTFLSVEAGDYRKGDEMEEWGCDYCRSDGKLSENNICPKCDAQYPDDDPDAATGCADDFLPGTAEDYRKVQP